MSQMDPLSDAQVPVDVLIGRRVHTLMWDARVKNKEIAGLLGIDPTAIGKKLRAEQKFSVEQLQVIARRLNTSIAYLVGETDDARPAVGASPQQGSNLRPAD